MSEEPGIARFEPRPAPNDDRDDLVVWAIDTRHQPLYWFPRDCPRGTFWARPGTSDADIDRFLGGDRMRRVHAMEASWLERMRTTRVWAYELPPGTFRPHETVGGYWISRVAVEPLRTIELGELVAMHADAGIELRIVPSIRPLWADVIASTLEFSGMRLRNAAPL